MSSWEGFNPLAEIAKNFPPLSEEEELHLTKEAYAKNDPSLKEKLLLHNIKMATAIARKNVSGIKDRDTLQEIDSVAVQTLIEVSKRYDPSNGNKLMTYAYMFIIRAVKDYLIELKTKGSLGKYAYRKAARWLRDNPDKSTEESITSFQKLFRCNAQTATNIFQFVKYGVSNFSSIDDSNFDEESSGPLSLLKTKSIFSNTKDENEEDENRNEEILQKISSDIEIIAKDLLTDRQFMIFDIIILGFIKNKKIITIKEAAEKLHCRYQNVDQIVEYTKMRLSTSDRGRKLVHVMDCVLNRIKIKRINSKGKDPIVDTHEINKDIIRVYEKKERSPENQDGSSEKLSDSSLCNQSV